MVIRRSRRRASQGIPRFLDLHLWVEMSPVVWMKANHKEHPD